MGIKISGIGRYLPERIITNDNIESRVKSTTSEWIKSKLGISERRVADLEDVSDLGWKAGILAITDARLTPDDIGLIIVSTSSPEKIAPPTASIIHKKLGIKSNVPAFDMNAVCSGFIYALSVAYEMSDKFKNILVIGCEAYSKNTNWNDKHSVFFGDGAGAVVINKSDKIFHYDLFSDASGTGLTGFSCEIGKPFVQHGKDVWDQAVKVLPGVINDSLEKYNIPTDNIKMLIPHQPSINLLKEIAKLAKFPFERVKTVMQKYGNIASASIPIALYDAIKNQEIKNEDKIMLLGIGSGWSWGSIILELEYEQA